MLRVIIITSGRRDTASYCLPLILKSANCEVVKVLLSENQQQDRWKFYKRKLKKISRIGMLGAINGVFLRKWFHHTHIDGVAIEDIEQLCQQHNIPFETTPYLNSAKTVEAARECKPDVGLSLGNSYISQKVFSIPVHGMLNIHGEVLPDFQNAQSVIWQIYEGSSMTGYTIHKINKGIDTGDIVKQEKFPIAIKSTLGETVAATSALILKRSAEGLVDVLNNFDHYYKQAYKQGKGKSYTTPTFWQYQKIKKQFRRLLASGKK